MGLEMKIDVLSALKEKGFSTYTLRKEKLLGVQTIQDINAGKVPGIKSIETLCKLLRCQPGALLRYVPDEKNE